MPIQPRLALYCVALNSSSQAHLTLPIISAFTHADIHTLRGCFRPRSTTLRSGSNGQSHDRQNGRETRKAQNDPIVTEDRLVEATAGPKDESVGTGTDAI